MSRTYKIAKAVVYEAYELVARNKGTYGIDRESIDDFEQDLKNNLYKIWNRMSSGSYFPPAVRRVDIPKSGGGSRPLGIPTVGDRIAQMVVKLYFEPQVEPCFHDSSYGYRPHRSAIQAVGVARKNCWQYPWVVDMDIQGFFEAIDHDLLMKAVRKHTDSAWQLLYIQRWLTAPVEHPDGRREDRISGTPQGGVISPLLANLFLHYVFDDWMDRNNSTIPFERYADDIICHCRTRRQAEYILRCVRERMTACGLKLHPEKTKIVNCQSGNTPDATVTPDIAQSFDFLGYAFCKRTARNERGQLFRSFLPAISRRKEKDIRQSVRKHLSRGSTSQGLRELAHSLNARIRGWHGYFGCYCESMFIRRIEEFIDIRIVNWAMKKYKRLKRRPQAAWQWCARLRAEAPHLFWHWSRALDEKSRMR